MKANKALLSRAKKYMAQDVDKNDRAEINALIERNDNDAIKELSERFQGSLSFGTAGIRGLLGAGESRFNRSVVMRVTYGFVRYLLDTIPEAAHQGIAIGKDGRYQSNVFQNDAAAVAAALGVRIHLLSGTSPTPLLAFAVKYLHAAAGIMVTASHNPWNYNGCKIYWCDGAQIVSPIDIGISDAIKLAPGSLDIERSYRSPLIQKVHQLEEAYVKAISELAYKTEKESSSLRIAYSALHGVGQRLFMKTLNINGYHTVFPVITQETPDAKFPTLSSPNPEDPKALELALSVAKKNECDLVLVNDPDADRLGVAVRTQNGRFKILNGNEIGSLLSYYILSQKKVKKPLIVSTIVSSRIVPKIAASFQARYSETWTGFKWIMKEAMKIESEEDYKFVFGYEEALGYSIGTAVRDKDGVSAGLLIAELANKLSQDGATLLDELEALRNRFGKYFSSQKSFSLQGTDGDKTIKQAIGRLRDKTFNQIASEPVRRFQDLKNGTESVLIYDLQDGGRVVVRPSGTEPKIKFYLEVVGDDTPRRFKEMEKDLLRVAQL